MQIKGGKSLSTAGFVWRLGAAAIAALLAFPNDAARADEDGISFWIPGFFGSLAAVPQQAPGWSVTSVYYHTSVSAGGDVARAREITIGRIPANLSVNASANVNANVNLGLLAGTYTFETPVLGGQASASLLTAYGSNSTSLAGSLTGALTLPGGGTIPFSRFDSIDSSLIAFGDLVPQFALRWNAGVNNYMTYITADLPVGAYQSTRLANLGLGHWAIDAGGGYTYFDPKTGHEASAVLGFTYNFVNPSTQYQSGVDMHLDWGASQFLTKQWQVGLVGYLYQQLGCDSGSGDRVGCFRSRVAGVGPQVGYIFPVGDMQGYLNLKAYGEFANENRPAGWNVWLTFNLQPTAATPPTSPRPRFTK
ncbi:MULTISPECIES: transporter [unclassified Bradyrhizobium]|uniref:SphA family protein n=1 Tax=unclassified Bradyrhizobium TaxID=2631580 RepID=UPI00247A7FE9|nr:MULTISPECIES: transporter [unclassified Bradyrhizobium]WGR70224.1 transporter [Bradyrhizobium sp. ISRA426]WGR82281.1 transporter [Bradyrhizobium sp. ISRA430]WGR85467.1 transporter [Bradyrhizobium sp. ISRA432]